MPTPITYNYYIKKSSDVSYPTEAANTNTTGSYTFENLDDDESYDIAVTATDNVGNTGVGEATGVHTLITIPDANDGSSIKVDGPIWNGDGTADITITKGDDVDDSLYIEYKKEGEDEYTKLDDDGTIEDLQPGDKIYVHLTDGNRDGTDKEIPINDTIAPTAQIDLSATSTDTKGSITATVTQTDAETGINITQTKYVYNTTATEIGTDDASYTGGTFSKTPQEIILNATTAGTYYLHVLSVDNKGNKKETISDAVIVNDEQGGSSTEPQNGAIRFGDLQWDSSYSTASVTVSKTTSDSLELQYKRNNEEWQTVPSGYTITDLKDGDLVTACLYDGANRGYYTTLNVTSPVSLDLQLQEGDTEDTLIVTATNPNGIAKVELITQEETREYSNAPTSVQENFTILENGTYTVQVTFTDGSSILKGIEVTNLNFDPVAQIGSTQYETLREAIDAVSANNIETTIQILRDFTQSVPVTITNNKNIVLDLQGHTITSTTGMIYNQGTLDIQSTGSEGAIISNHQDKVCIANEGDLTITSGKLVANKNKCIKK